jgi:hypothetical protein
MQILDGKKTYAVVLAVLVLLAILQFGSLSPEAQGAVENAVKAGLALAVAALRNGISNSVNPKIVPFIDPLVKQAEDNLLRDFQKYLNEQRNKVINVQTQQLQSAPPPPPVVG